MTAETQIHVPAAIYEWKASAMYRDTARHLQESNAALFETAFAAGDAVLQYQRSANGDGTYLLAAWNESPAPVNPP